MRLKLLLLTGFLWSAATAQHPVYFRDALKTHLPKYNAQSDFEYERGNLERAAFLFDSLVQNHIVGTRFENYILKNARGGKYKLEKTKKPVVILTYAHWYVLNKGEIPALNKLAKKYARDVQFVVIFWDKKRNVKPLAGKFSSNIKVCYAHETYRHDARTVASLKHSFGFPTSYYLSENLDVVDITRGGLPPDPKAKHAKAFNEHYALFQDRLTHFFLRKKDMQTLVASQED
jgi:thiol-disulfide isomerase/thioredoxin